MGYNARNDEIRDNIARMRRDHEAYADALAKATGDCSSGVSSRQAVPKALKVGVTITSY